MKKSAHAYSALVKNRQFRARIAHKECGHFKEVERKVYYSNSRLETLRIAVYPVPVEDIDK